MEKIDTDYNDELEKFRLNFSKCANRDVAPLRGTVQSSIDWSHCVVFCDEILNHCKASFRRRVLKGTNGLQGSPADKILMGKGRVTRNGVESRPGEM